MKRLLVVALILVLAGISLGATSTRVPQAIRAPQGFAGTLFSGTLALYVTQGTHTRFICTAEPFEKILGGYRLISAGHCVQLVPADVKFFVADEISGPLTPVTMIKAHLGDGMDFSEFELSTSRTYPIFELGDERDSRVGDAVINSNFAAGVVKQLSFGTISSGTIPLSPKCEIDDCAGDFLVQLYGAGGSSGSAVVSERTHKVIGLVVIGFGSQIGFAVEPISKFSQFLAQPSQPHPDDEDGQ